MKIKFLRNESMKWRLNKKQIEEKEIMFDFNVEQEIVKMRRNQELFESIVGESPLNQIDWIIEHSLNKFNYWLYCSQRGTIYTPATVKEAPKIPKGNYETAYVRGGRGNQMLVSFEMKHEIIE
jgi:hypothetical protein